MALFLTLAASACREEYRTGEKTKTASAAPPSMSAWRFEISEPWGPMYLPAWLPRLSIVKQTNWPSGLEGAYKLGQDRAKGKGEPTTDAWPGRIGITWHSDPFTNPTVKARFASLNSRKFFLVSAPASPAPAAGAAARAPLDRFAHSLVILDVDGGMQEQVLLRGADARHDNDSLDWDALPFKDSIVVVYVAGEAINFMVGTFTQGDLKFSKPRVAYQASGENRTIQSVRLRVEKERLHVLWCQTMQLLHASTTEPSEGWSDPVTISTTANCSTCAEGADLVVDGQDAFVAWSDNRLHGKFSKTDGYDNDLKLFVAASHDGGATFAPPVLFSSKDNKDEEVDRVFLTLSEDKVVLCWTEDARGLWHYGFLDRDIQKLEVGAVALDDRKMLEAYTSRMKKVVGEIPYTPPRLTAAKRPVVQSTGD